jgi:hypothetical protein
MLIGWWLGKHYKEPAGKKNNINNNNGRLILYKTRFLLTLMVISVFICIIYQIASTATSRTNHHSNTDSIQKSYSGKQVGQGKVTWITYIDIYGWINLFPTNFISCFIYL